MKKRNQINVTFEDVDFDNINEYCRVHDITPQGLLKAGARRMIEEDILERRADLQTLKSWREMKAGLSEPIDDIVDLINEDFESDHISRDNIV